MQRFVPLLSFFLVGSCSQDVTLSKEGNAQPQAVINAPDDQSEWTAIDTIDFLGTVADGNGFSDLRAVVWLSDVAGELGTSEPDAEGFVRLSTTLQAGTHSITLSGPNDPADFDLYFLKKTCTGPYNGWAILDASDEWYTAQESLSYTDTSGGTYVAGIIAYDGTGNYTVTATHPN